MEKKKKATIVIFLLLLPMIIYGLTLKEDAISFKMKDLNNGDIDSQAFMGKKPVLLFFWATW